jgi:antitoxin component of MazEF toxin-antitoxin module
MRQKIIKTGNSLAVTIPSKLVKQVGLKAGDRVESNIKAESGTIEYTFIDMRQLPLSQRILKK